MERQRISRRNGESEIPESSTSGWSQTEIRTDMEIEEEFCAILESIKTEEERNADIKPATLPEENVVQRIEGRSESSGLTHQSNNNVCLSLLCRLCAMAYNDMVDIFSPLGTTKDILEKIEYSLPITVKNTDTLPKQICRFCLVELERCYRFHKTVAVAEEQLLAFEKLACIKSEETEINNYLSPQYNTQLGSAEYDNVDGPSETNSDTEMNDGKSTIPKDSQTAIRLRSCSVVLSILKTCSKDDSGAENGEKSLSNTEDKSADSTTEVFNVGRNESENNQESTSDSGVNIENPDDFAPAHSRNQLFRCDMCAKTFKRKKHLTQHSRIHTNQGLRPHKCNTCAKTFKWKGSLTQHSKIHANQGLRPHKCNTCAKTFKWKTNLTRHSNFHTNEGLQRHKCNTCAKTFKWKYDLTEHSKLHTNHGPQLYKCNTCAKTFQWKASLIRHSEIHTNEGLQLHKCNTCAKTFKRKINLTQHSKIHTGKGLHSCQYCGKAFTQKRRRDEHHRVHTNERPSKCVDCKKSFSLRGKLKRHTLVHLGKRNHRCPPCDKSFRRSLTNESHMESVHLNNRQWQCAHCNKTFGHKSVLRRHLGTCKLRSE